MNINYEIFNKIKKFKKNAKQKIIITKGFINKDYENKIYKSVNSSLTKPTKIFKHKTKLLSMNLMICINLITI